MVTPGCKHDAGGARLKKGYRVRMTLLAGISVGDWDRLEVPEGYRAEIIAGELVVSPSAPPRHGAAQAVLTALLVAAVPPGLVVLVDTQWQVSQSGLVATAPRPDILVVEAAAIAGDTRLTSTPVLAVEILSQSDSHLLERGGRPRIEAKRDDYARNGLGHFLEVSMTPDKVVRVDRYELRQGRLDVVATAMGPSTLEAHEPFPYRIPPQALLPF